MNSKITSNTDLSNEHDSKFLEFFSAARLAKAKLLVRPHRAITSLNSTPYLIIQAITLPVLICSALFWAKPFIFDLWRRCIIFWSSGLYLPFGLSTRINDAGQYGLQLAGDIDGSQLPNPTTLVITAICTIILFSLSFLIRNNAFPLRYPIRIVAVIQFIALIYFWLAPSQFPYHIARHSEELLTIGYVVMFTTPLMLSIGYYILNISLVKKLFYTSVILFFMLILVPHQVLAQALILQHFSVLFMPVLYICFGAVFDALVFVALYSWIASNAPAKATI